MPVPFEPRFVDLVRNFSTTVGTGNFVLGPVVTGSTGFTAALSTGDRFYYCAINADKVNEREIGRGTLLAGGSIAREAVGGAPTNFTSGTKTIALVAAGEWFAGADAASQWVAARNIPAFADIATADIAAAATVIETSLNGHHARLLRDADQGQYTAIGQALIGAGTMTAAQVNAILGRIRTADAGGTYWRLDCSLLDVGLFGAAGDGSTDDTAAIQAALNYARHWRGTPVRLGPFVYAVTSVSVPAGVTIQTAGFNTVLRQKAGQPAATRTLVVTGGNVRIGDLAFEGNIATDSDEQMHCLLVQANASTGNLSNVSLGNLKGSNVRGDVLYVGTAGGAKLKSVRAGHVTGSNVLRNVVSIVGGEDVAIASIGGDFIGYMHFDCEPNVGGGGCKGIRIGRIAGRYAAVVPPTAAEPADQVWIGSLDLDPAYGGGTGSTPAYAPGAPQQHAFQTRNCRSLAIHSFKANGFNGQALKPVWNSGELADQHIIIGSAEITDCCKTEAVYNSYIQPVANVTQLQIDRLVAVTTLATHRVIDSGTNVRIGHAVAGLVTGSSLLRNCTDGAIGRLTQSVSGGGNGGLTLANCTRCQIGGGTAVGDRLLSNSSGCRADHLVSTMVTGHIVGTGTCNRFVGCTLGGVFSEYLYYAVNSTPTFAIDGTNGLAFGQIATVPTASFLGRNAAGTGAAEALSVATAKTLLNLAGSNSGDQTITLTGDVGGSGSGSFAATIAANAVSYAKMQNVSAGARLLGRGSAGAGAVQELTLGSRLSLSGTVLSAIADWAETTLASDYTNATTTFTTITDGTNPLTYTPPANSNFEIQAVLLVQTATATNLPRIGVSVAAQGAAAHGAVQIDQTGATATARVTADGSFTTTAINVQTAAGDLPAANSPFMCVVTVRGKSGAAPAAISVQMACETAAASTCFVKAGSQMRVKAS